MPLPDDSVSNNSPKPRQPTNRYAGIGSGAPFRMWINGKSMLSRLSVPQPAATGSSSGAGTAFPCFRVCCVVAGLTIYQQDEADEASALGRACQEYACTPTEAVLVQMVELLGPEESRVIWENGEFKEDQ